MDCPVWQKSCAGKMQNGNKTSNKKCNIRSEDNEWHRVKNIWNLYQGSCRRKV